MSDGLRHDVIITFFGELIFTHLPDDCIPPCSVHSPSEHHMREWPQNWHSERRVMERVCMHMVSHPDPDDISVRHRRSARVHNCDGCCAPPQ